MNECNSMLFCAGGEPKSSRERMRWVGAPCAPPNPDRPTTDTVTFLSSRFAPSPSFLKGSQGERLLSALTPGASRRSPGLPSVPVPRHGQVARSGLEAGAPGVVKVNKTYDFSIPYLKEIDPIALGYILQYKPEAFQLSIHVILFTVSKTTGIHIVRVTT
ncbi:hypothetical protein QAD02_019068 [Eretmocerus hayati]|uniref:Uncharacterized protein n=1 Tax=Eretmocerus hayati TaxID=131215 RepID=A0ACC2PKD7_9HYME|nr:hypothetical protein QAD02_019068 [Eretmocerus hayati]